MEPRRRDETIGVRLAKREKGKDSFARLSLGAAAAGCCWLMPRALLDALCASGRLRSRSSCAPHGLGRLDTGAALAGWPLPLPVLCALMITTSSAKRARYSIV